MADPTPDYPKDLTEVPLDELMTYYKRAAGLSKAYEDEKDRLSAEIIGRMKGIGFLLGQQYVRDDGSTVQMSNRVTRTINGAKLLARSVDPQIVADCTDETVSKTFVLVYLKGEKKDDGNQPPKK